MRALPFAGVPTTFLHSIGQCLSLAFPLLSSSKAVPFLATLQVQLRSARADDTATNAVARSGIDAVCRSTAWGTDSFRQTFRSPHETVQDIFITPLYQQHASHTLASRAYGPQPHMTLPLPDRFSGWKRRSSGRRCSAHSRPLTVTDPRCAMSRVAILFVRSGLLPTYGASSVLSGAAVLRAKKEARRATIATLEVVARKAGYKRKNL